MSSYLREVSRVLTPRKWGNIRVSTEPGALQVEPLAHIAEFNLGDPS